MNSSEIISQWQRKGKMMVEMSLSSGIKSFSGASENIKYPNMDRNIPKRARAASQTGAELSHYDDFSHPGRTGEYKANEVWCISFSKTITPDVNNPRMFG